MAELYDMNRAIRITRFVQCERQVNVMRIVSKALDGTSYLQIIGTPNVDFKIVCYVDRVGKTALETAESDGNLLRITVKSGTFYGRITEAKYSERQAGDTFQVTLKLAMEAAE